MTKSVDSNRFISGITRRMREQWIKIDEQPHASRLVSQADA